MNQFCVCAKCLDCRNDLWPVHVAKTPHIREERPVVALDTSRCHVGSLLAPIPQRPPKNPAQARERWQIQKYDHGCARHSDVERSRIVTIHHPRLPRNQRGDPFAPRFSVRLHPTRQPIRGIKMDQRQAGSERKVTCERAFARAGTSDHQDPFRLHPRSTLGQLC